MAKTAIDPMELSNLLKSWRTWKSDLQAYNLRVEFHINHKQNQKELFANINAPGIPFASDDTLNQSVEVEFDFIIKYFSLLINCLKSEDVIRLS